MKTVTVCLTLLAACATQNAPAEHGGTAVLVAPIVSAPPSISAPPSTSAPESSSAPPTPSVSPSPSATPTAAPSVETPPAAAPAVSTPVAAASVVARANDSNYREARRQQARRQCGPLVVSKVERWRSAVENYVSQVRPENQRPLGAAGVPFAKYLNAMHNRIHPLFADCFLGSLDELPPTHPMNDVHLVTRLEVVLSSDGRVKRMGVVRTSGLTIFDIFALDAVERAQPFGPAPSEILSADGNVYLQWQLHRDEVFACSTIDAHPFLLVNAP
jgi:TonB family protein